MASTIQRKIDHYRKDLDDGKMLPRIMTTDHTCRHVKRTDVDLLERILSEQKRCNSSFTSKEDADMFIDETLYNKMPEIVDWLENSDTKQFAAVAQFAGEITGKAIVQNRSDIKAYEYDSVTVVLGRDPYGYGFELVTAYPSESQEKCQLNQNLTSVLKQTPSYQKGNPVEQTFMEYQISDSPYQVNKYENHKGQTVLQMEVRDKEAKYLINVGSRPEQCHITKIPKDKNIRKSVFYFTGNPEADQLRHDFPDIMETAETLYTSILKKRQGRDEKVKSLENDLIHTEQTKDAQFE